MSPEVLVPFFLQSGVFGLIVWWIRHTHRDAIRAHDQRATEWQRAAEAEAKRNDELVAQLLHIHSAVRAAPTEASAS
jgi:hypothetical protein